MKRFWHRCGLTTCCPQGAPVVLWRGQNLNLISLLSLVHWGSQDTSIRSHSEGLSPTVMTQHVFYAQLSTFTTKYVPCTGNSIEVSPILGLAIGPYIPTLDVSCWAWQEGRAVANGAIDLRGASPLCDSTWFLHARPGCSIKNEPVAC